MIFFFFFRRSGVRIPPCSSFSTSVVELLIFGNSFCCSHTFRMSTRRLPVILIVSRVKYPFISCCLLRGVPVVAGGGYYLVCVISHVSNLRLIHSLLIIILLLPLLCALRNPLRTWLLFADSSVDCYYSCLRYFHSMTVSCPSGLCLSASLLLVTSQARLESDVLEPQPGVTAGSRRIFQALGDQDRSPAVPYDIPL